MSKLQRITQLIEQEDASFRRTLERAQRLHQLSSLIEQCLDTPVAQHCQVANLRGDTLIIQSDSPSWAAKLRYLSPQLIDCLQQYPQLQVIQRIKVRVTPLAQPAERPARRLQLSSQNAQLIENLAESVSDQALGQALRRLASHRKQRS